PDGPSRAISSPERMSSETSCSAEKRLNSLRTLATRTSTALPPRAALPPRLADDQHRDGGVRQHLRGLAAEQHLLHAAPAMRRHHDEIAAVELGVSDDGFGRRLVDFMRQFRGEPMFGAALLDIGKPLLHQFIYLLVVAAEGIVDATEARG